jgi:ketosteroid isomerase-like protein
MSERNVDLVRRGYQALNSGDIDGVLSLVDPDIEWIGYTHLPESGNLRGRDEVREWLERFLDAWEEMDVQIVEVVEADDKVAVLVRLSGRGKGSGVEVEGGVDAHVWTIRDGSVVAVTLHQGTRDALRELDQ